ncbi:MAG: lysylphosphatidylglycerol synthase domain-containing protein [Gaiellaceae bacterium]
MERTLRLTRSRWTRLGLNLGSLVLVAVVLFFTVKHFRHQGWPLHHANVWLVVAAAGLFLLGYGFKAFGWRRLFPGGERPSALALAAAGGAAAVTGIALPGRFDEAVRISVVRRYPGKRAGLGGICLTLVMLGLIDSAALTPLAGVAAGITATSGLLRAGLIVVSVAGVAAATLVLLMRRISHARRLGRFRLARWMQTNCCCPREASKAWALVSMSWLTRGAALFVLLHALGLGSPASISLALAFLCASAASAALPIAPAGAATQAGAGAAILIASGVGSSEAVAFAVSAQALAILAGASIVVAAALWQAGLRLAPARL